jgi:hypothetical protein
MLKHVMAKLALSKYCHHSTALRANFLLPARNLFIVEKLLNDSALVALNGVLASR